MAQKNRNNNEPVYDRLHELGKEKRRSLSSKKNEEYETHDPQTGQKLYQPQINKQKANGDKLDNLLQRVKKGSNSNKPDLTLYGGDLSKNNKMQS